MTTDRVSVVDTAALRATAEAATPGERYWTPYGRDGGQTLATPGPLLGTGLLGEMRGHEYNIFKTTDDWPPTHEDAEFIVAFDPPTVLLLLDELDTLRATVARIEALADGLHDEGQAYTLATPTATVAKSILRDAVSRIRAALVSSVPVPEPDPDAWLDVRAKWQAAQENQ